VSRSRGALLPDNLDSLTPTSRQLATALAARPWAADFYLAGSAALALHLGHRPVVGLDLMGGTARLTSPERRDLLADLLEIDCGIEVETARDGYLSVRSASGVPVRFFHYPYPLVDPPGEALGLAVASPIDLGLMKLAAIVSRGTRRDFLDLHLLCRHLPLDEILARAGEKFGHVRDFPLQALKGLADLDSAPEEPLPALTTGVSWEEVAAWTRSEVRRSTRTRMGLSLPERDP
jgi:hypothetical protein